MAYLNVRDRRIEATIAYVGPALAGTTTNFARLGEHEQTNEVATASGGGLTLEWRPKEREGFDDCELRVKLFAPQRALEGAQLDDVLARADGVVVVVDATDAARAETMHALHLVREAVAKKDATMSLPVVVQANKADLAGPVAVEELVATTRWPVVGAAATTGKGVMETLDSALEAVLAAMRASPPSPPSGVEKNPLLSALQEVLRESISEQVAALEHALIARTVAAFSSRFDALGKVIAANHAEMTAAMGALSARTEGLEALVLALRTTLGDVDERRDDLTDKLDRHARSLAEMAARIGELGTSVKDAASAKGLATLEERMRDLLASQARTEREHLVSVGGAIRRQVEGVAVDVRNGAWTDKHQAVANQLSELRAQADALHGAMDGASASLEAISPRVVAIETSVQREMAAQTKRLLEAVAGAQAETGGTIERTEQRANEIKGHLDELIDELKKRKRGWFG